MQADLQGGKFVYKAPWGPQHLEQGGGGGGGSRTAHSLGAFLTPGVLEGERRSNATPTVVSLAARLFGRLSFTSRQAGRRVESMCMWLLGGVLLSGLPAAPVC
jgi:hypothetical protein